MIDIPPYFGEVLSLLAAVIWASAVIMFKKSGESVNPLALNMFKNLLAFLLVLPTLALFGIAIPRGLAASDWMLLLLSGALGIGLADTMFFKSLNLLGAGLTSIVDCLYSPFMILMSMLWLGERLTYVQAIGALLIISAVLTVANREGRGGLPIGQLLAGIGWAVGGLFLMALGLVMIKPILETTPLLWAMEIRLAGGIVILTLVIALFPSRGRIIRSLTRSHAWGYTIGGSLLGGYLAMVTWLGGMKFTQASVAAALNQTSNIFIFVFAVIFLHGVINLRRIIGIILAVAGVFLVLLGSHLSFELHVSP